MKKSPVFWVVISFFIAMGLGLLSCITVVCYKQMKKDFRPVRMYSVAYDDYDATMLHDL